MFKFDFDLSISDNDKFKLIYRQLNEMYNILVDGGADINKVCLVANGPIADDLLLYYKGGFGTHCPKPQWKRGWNVLSLFFWKWDFALYTEQLYYKFTMASNIGSLCLIVDNLPMPYYWISERVLNVQSPDRPPAYINWKLFKPLTHFCDLKEGF